MSDLTTEELRRIAEFLMRDIERNAGYTDARQRNESLLFGALFGIALRVGAVYEGSTIRARR